MQPIRLDEEMLAILTLSIRGKSYLLSSASSFSLQSSFFPVKKCDMMSIGTGKMMVEFFSAEIELRVLKYHNGQFFNDASSSPEDSAAEARLGTDRWCQRPL